MPEELHRVPIGFPPDQYEWLRVTAFHQHKRMAQLVREAVQEYRERREPQMPLPITRGAK